MNFAAAINRGRMNAAADRKRKKDNLKKAGERKAAGTGANSKPKRKDNRPVNPKKAKALQLKKDKQLYL